MNNLIQVVYSEKQVADPGKQPIEGKGWTPSPSARKPMELAAKLADGSIDKVLDIHLNTFKACREIYKN